MIRAVFRKTAEGLSGVRVSGHAGYGEAGEDIVCAAVTSAVQMASNGITEVLGISMPVTVGGNLVEYTLPGDSGAAARAFLEALHLHLGVLSRDYPENIELSVEEAPEK